MVNASEEEKIVYASLKANDDDVRQVMLSHMDNCLKFAFEFSTICEMISQQMVHELAQG